MAGAQEVREFEVTCPQGTSKLDPLVTDLDMPTRTVLNIRIRVPPGPNGVMGFAIGSAGAFVIPINDGEYIVGSDEIFEWSLEDQINSGAWQVTMYNLGIYPHTIYMTWTVELPDLPTDSTLAQPMVVANLTPPIVPDPGLTLTDLPTPASLSL